MAFTPSREVHAPAEKLRVDAGGEAEASSGDEDEEMDGEEEGESASEEEKGDDEEASGRCGLLNGHFEIASL